jgi:hypothetical protein
MEVGGRLEAELVVVKAKLGVQRVARSVNVMLVRSGPQNIRGPMAVPMDRRGKYLSVDMLA